MKTVQRQLDMLKQLIAKMEKKTGDRSFWKTGSIPNRVNEAKAIHKSAEALVSIVRAASP